MLYSYFNCKAIRRVSKLKRVQRRLREVRATFELFGLIKAVVVAVVSNNRAGSARGN